MSSSLLYHYTSQGGLLGILQRRELWATDIRFFNDSKELHHAIDVAESRLDQAMIDAPERARTILLRLLQSLRFQRSIIGLAGPYIISFSSSGDRLSQWRGYAGGCGYSLGFAVEPPTPIFNPPEAELRQCEYSEDALGTHIDSLIDLFTAPDFKMSSVNPRNYEMTFATELSWLAPLYKDPGFSEEGEWRLIIREAFVANSLAMQFRPGRSTLIPYYAIPFVYKGHAVLTLREIVIGPTANPQLAEAALSDLLVWADLDDDVAIKYSSIPFRDV
jgi:hypothetical protein